MEKPEVNTPTMVPTDDLVKSIVDLKEIVTQKNKKDDEKFAEFEKAMVDVQAEMKKAPKRVPFAEMDPRILAFDSSQKAFEAIVKAKPPSGAYGDIVRDIQRANDDLYLTELLRQGHKMLGVSVPDRKDLNAYKRFTSIAQDLQKALATTGAGYGPEWIPTGFSQEIAGKIILELKQMALIPSFTPPTNPFSWPYAISRPLAQTVVEATDYSTFFTLAEANRAFAGLTPTKKATFTAKKMRALELYSREFGEDTVSATLPWLQNQIVQAIAEGWENAGLNGDTVTTHIDTDITIPSGDVRTFIDGFRKRVKETQSNVPIQDMVATAFSIANLRTLRKGMGVYGCRLPSLNINASLSAYYALLNCAEVLTMEKYGPNATIVAGELGRVDNIPILISEFWRNDLSSAGVYVSGQTRTGLLIIHRDSFMIARWPGLGVETDRSVLSDQSVIVLFERGDMQCLDADAAKVVGYGMNVPA